MIVEGLFVLGVILAKARALRFLREISQVGGRSEVVGKHPEARGLSHLSEHVLLVHGRKQIVDLVLAVAIVLAWLGLILGVRLRVGRGLALCRLQQLLQVDDLVVEVVVALKCDQLDNLLLLVEFLLNLL